MCGIFGFISSNGTGPEIARLRRLALITQSRGEHAFGLAWLDAENALHTFKRPGPARAWLSELERCRDATIVIGHCRFATHGSPLDHRNNHPHVAGGGLLVHNGVVHNHAELAWRYDLRPQGECDSEILGLLIAHCRGTITRRAVWMASHAAGDLAVLGLWRNPSRLLVARRGKPLHVGQNRHGCYFASLADGLPPQAREVADGSVRVLVNHDGSLELERRPVGLAQRCVEHVRPGREQYALTNHLLSSLGPRAVESALNAQRAAVAGSHPRITRFSEKSATAS